MPEKESPAPLAGGNRAGHWSAEQRPNTRSPADLQQHWVACQRWPRRVEPNIDLEVSAQVFTEPGEDLGGHLQVDVGLDRGLGGDRSLTLPMRLVGGGR